MTFPINVSRTGFWRHHVTRGIVRGAPRSRRGLAVAGLSLRALLYYGDADPMAPLGWGKYFAAKLPNARLHTLEGEGHFSGLVNHIGEMLAH